MWDRIVAMMAPSSTTTGGGVGGVEGQVGLVVGTPEKDREKREEFSAEGGWGGVAGTRPEFFADGEEALKAEESLLRSLVGNEGKGKGKGKEERVMAVGTETRAYGTKSNRVLGQLLAVINGGQEDDAIRKVLECEEMVDVGEQLVGAGAKVRILLLLWLAAVTFTDVLDTFFPIRNEDRRRRLHRSPPRSTSSTRRRLRLHPTTSPLQRSTSPTPLSFRLDRSRRRPPTRPRPQSPPHRPTAIHGCLPIADSWSRSIEMSSLVTASATVKAGSKGRRSRKNRAGRGEGGQTSQEVDDAGYLTSDGSSGSSPSSARLLA
jgi:hypothetical protein